MPTGPRIIANVKFQPLSNLKTVFCILGQCFRQLRLSRRPRPRQILPARDTFASAFLFPFAPGVAGASQSNARPPPRSGRIVRRFVAQPSCRTVRPLRALHHQPAATGKQTSENSESRDCYSLSPGERVRVRASVTPILAPAISLSARRQPDFDLQSPARFGPAFGSRRETIRETGRPSPRLRGSRKSPSPARACREKSHAPLTLPGTRSTAEH